MTKRFSLVLVTLVLVTIVTLAGCTNQHDKYPKYHPKYHPKYPYNETYSPAQARAGELEPCIKGYTYDKGPVKIDCILGRKKQIIIEEEFPCEKIYLPLVPHARLPDINN